MRTNVLQALLGRHDGITLMLRLTCLVNKKLNTNLLFRLGNDLGDGDKDLTGARPLLSHSNRPRVRKIINDNYCVHLVAGKVSPVCVPGQENYVVTGVRKISNSVTVTGNDSHLVTGNLETRTHFPVYCANHVPIAGGSPQKKGVNPDHRVPIKSVKGVSCVDQLSSVQNVTNVPLVVPNLPVGARLHQFW